MYVSRVGHCGFEWCSLPLRHGVFTQVRRETGRKERVQVPYDEGGASHIGPESCVSDREVWGEALTGEAVGQVLSHVTKPVRDADAFCVAEGNMGGALSRVSRRSRVVRDPGTAPTLSAREPGDLMAGRLRKGGPHREGWRAEADDARP